MANTGPDLNASNFFITLTEEPIDTLFKKHTIFGIVAEDDSFKTLDKINQVHVNQSYRPLQNIRIRHTLIIDDPFSGNEFNFNRCLPSRSPSPPRTKP